MSLDKVDKEFLIQVLATPTGDSLKAMVLREVLGMTIGVKKPDPLQPTDSIKPEPLQPQPRMDQTRISSVPVRPMPSSVKFEDVDEKTVAAESQASTKEWVLYEEAATLRGTTIAAVYTAASQGKWEKRREPGVRGVLLKREDVMRGVKHDDA